MLPKDNYGSEYCSCTVQSTLHHYCKKLRGSFPFRPPCLNQTPSHREMSDSQVTVPQISSRHYYSTSIVQIQAGRYLPIHIQNEEIRKMFMKEKPPPSQFKSFVQRINPFPYPLSNYSCPYRSSSSDCNRLHCCPALRHLHRRCHTHSHHRMWVYVVLCTHPQKYANMRTHPRRRCRLRVLVRSSVVGGCGLNL
jgi:hypothetical protein